MPSFLKTSPGSWPLLILTRHFFRRLFLNETVFFEEQAIQKTIGIIAILSIFPAYIAESLLFINLLERERGTAWSETALFTTLIMLLIGLITLFEWDVIFLDRRDFQNLRPLPLRPLSVFPAKFLSLVLFVGLFAAGINSLSSLVFAMYLSESRGYGLLAGFLLLLIHLLVMLAAGGFIFFSMALLVGLFNILLRGKFFSGLLDTIRFGLIVAHIFFLYFFVLDTKWIQERFENIQALKNTPTPFMMNYPPLWFTGLYQVLSGNREPFFQELASRALLSLSAVIGAFFLLALISYSRYLKKVSPEGARHLRPSIVRKIFEPVLNFTILRDPGQRGSFWFYHSVLNRSRIHRNKIIIYFSLGLGLSLILPVSTGRYFWKYQAGNMLSLPLVLSFFLLVGAKEASSLPANQPASWVFMVSEGAEKWPYLFFCFQKMPLPSSCPSASPGAFYLLFNSLGLEKGRNTLPLLCSFCCSADGNSFLPAAQVPFRLFLPAGEKQNPFQVAGLCYRFLFLHSYAALDRTIFSAPSFKSDRTVPRAGNNFNRPENIPCLLFLPERKNSLRRFTRTFACGTASGSIRQQKSAAATREEDLQQKKKGKHQSS